MRKSRPFVVVGGGVAAFALIKSNRVPDRLKEFLSKIYIPTAEEVEVASKNILREAKD